MIICREVVDRPNTLSVAGVINDTHYGGYGPGGWGRGSLFLCSPPHAFSCARLAAGHGCGRGCLKYIYPPRKHRARCSIVYV